MSESKRRADDPSYLYIWGEKPRKNKNGDGLKALGVAMLFSAAVVAYEHYQSTQTDVAELDSEVVNSTPAP